MLARAALPAFLLILLAFVLFLLTTLSVPYIKSIWLLAIDNNAGTRVKLGVFSACYTTPVGVARELGTSSSGCLPTKLGYQFYFGGESIGSGPGVRPVMLVETGLSRALVLNPITVAFSGISLIWAFCAWFFAKRVFEMITFVSLILTVIFGWVAFGLNYAVADTARSRLSLSGPLGNGVWMTLAGAIALTLATIAALVGMFGKYSEKRQAVHVKGDGKF